MEPAMAVFLSPRDSILAKLDAGDLPRNKPANTYAGCGAGYRCVACDRTITPYDVEYEMAFDGGVSHRMHLACADLWQVECERRAADEREPTR
jgi:hypothetical protein